VSHLVVRRAANRGVGYVHFTISGTFAAAASRFPIHGPRRALAAATGAGIARPDEGVAQSGIQTIPGAEARADAVASGGRLFVRSPYLARRRGTTKPWLQAASIPVRPLA